MIAKTPVVGSALLLSAAAFLAACGGGGRDAGVTASAPVAISSANATQVAAAGVDAADGLTGSTSGILGVVPAATGQGHATDVNVVATLIGSVRQAPQANTGGGVHAAAVLNQTESCDSGSISLSFNDADNDQALSTGDSVTLSASHCVSGGVSLDGSISMNGLIVSGDQITPPYSLQFSLNTNGFTVSAGGETVSIRGAGTIAESSNDGVSSVSSFSGSGIEISTSGETLSLTDYQITETHNDATGAYTYAIDATISSTTLGGSVHVITDVALSGVGAFDPDAGQIRCVGADNSSVKLSVIDSASVQLEVDADGDGIADNVYTESWTAL